MIKDLKTNYLKVSKENSGDRLDKFLFKYFSNLNFFKIQKLIRKGYFKVNRIKTKFNYKIKENDKIILGSLFNKKTKEKSFFLDSQSFCKEINILKKNIIHEDDKILVLNKPPGLAVQGGSKVKFNIDSALPQLTSGSEKLRLVHRIDKQTSGILIIAKSKEVSRDITKLFKENKVFKKYIAIVNGIPNKNKGSIILPINKKYISGQERMVIDLNSKKYANTYYKVIDSKKSLSLLELIPKTGRTHQIRVHLQYISTPILGDQKYLLKGEGKKNTKKVNLYLHAKEVNFILNNRKYSFSADLPNYFTKTLLENKLKLKNE